MSARSSAGPRATGGCLCGAVRYRVFAALAPISACHCSQCRRQHGALGCYTGGLPVEAVEIEGREQIAWYQASPTARRGFCRTCGSKLFWQPIEGHTIDIVAGSLDQPTGLEIGRHIYVASKGDYYEIADDLPRFAASSAQ
ncbi:MAG: GFA family protein [Pseudomonadota bacterium]